MKDPETAQFFFLRANGAYQRINYADLLYCESLSGGYTRVVTKSETYVHNNTLMIVQRHLPDKSFCRIHAGFIVGLAYIKSFDRLRLTLLDPPADGSYKAGFAYRTEFTIGTRYAYSLDEKLVMASSRRGGYRHKLKKLELETVMEEMEMERD